MIQIAADLARLYISFMEQKGVETDQHRYYIKWLRYYLDFCPKYKFKRQNKESLSSFLEKLKEKKQAESLRKQGKQRGVGRFPGQNIHCSGLLTLS